MQMLFLSTNRPAALTGSSGAGGARCVAQFPRQVFGSFSAAVLARRHIGELTHGE